MLARKLLVCKQVALSLQLLVGAGLFVGTLRNLRNEGPGYPTNHLLSFSVDPSLSGYSDERTRFFDEQLRTMPASTSGIESVGLSSVPLLQGSASVSYTHLDVYKRQAHELAWVTGFDSS